MLIGSNAGDDAGVYQVSDSLALIQSLDFFTPIVDDPFDFGRIAAANALSDVYAMGGEPKTAMNIVAFPAGQMDMKILRDVLAGGLETLAQAKVDLLGGHSIRDNELKYGLSVTGFVHPKKVIANKGLRAGDALVLTKPLGIGIINTAIKTGNASPETIADAVSLMTALNRGAAMVMQSFPVSACTDVTGFGMLGHLSEMIENTDTDILLDSKAVPLMDNTVEFAERGLVPGGCFSNGKFRKDMVDFDSSVAAVFRDILFDPQTSGGLVIGVPEAQAQELQARLTDQGVSCAAVIGQVSSGRGRIAVF